MYEFLSSLCDRDRERERERERERDSSSIYLSKLDGRLPAQLYAPMLAEYLRVPVDQAGYRVKSGMAEWTPSGGLSTGLS